MKNLVAEAMKDGGSVFPLPSSTCLPALQKTDEIVELAKVAHQYGGIYATHQRSEANALDESLTEVFEIGQARANTRRDLAPETAYKKNWGRHAGSLEEN